MPRSARDSSIRIAASRTSRFALATRSTRPVSCGSPNRFHQDGSIGAETGWLGVATGCGLSVNQVVGVAVSGEVKSGPSVQPPSREIPARIAKGEAAIFIENRLLIIIRQQ